MADYRVTVGGRKQYKVGISYQIPSKSLQYLNEILDDFSGEFDDNNTSFLLKLEGEPYYPINEQQILVSLNNIILEPKVDYQITGNTIVFTTPPPQGSEFFCVAMATTADLTRTINFIIEAGSGDMTPGIKGQVTLDITGTIDSWTVIADQPGYALLDIKKCSYQNYPLMTSITGTEKPYIGSPNNPTETKRKDEDLSTWDRLLNAGDILQYEIVAASNVKRLLVALKVHL
jgi:hypothetical protein